MKRLTADDFRDNAQRGVGFGNADQGLRSEADFDSLVDLGVGHVRTFLRPSFDGDNVTASEHDLVTLDATINSLEARGIYVVLCVDFGPAGKPGGRLWTIRAARASAVRLWRLLAIRYRRRSVIAGFDLANELHAAAGFGGQAEWRAFMLSLCRVVRRIDAQRVLIVEPTPHARIDALAGVEPLPLRNVVYSVHSWLPYEFTHAKVDPVYAGPELIPYSPALAERLRDYCAPLIAWARLHSLPIYIGETGCNVAAPGAEQHMADSVAIFHAEGFSWSYHEHRGWPDWDAERNLNLKAQLRLSLKGTTA